MNYIIFGAFVFFLFACTNKFNKNTGYIDINKMFWDNKSNKYVEDDLTPTNTYFYLDSLIVYKRNMIMVREDQLGNSTVNLKLMYYCFANLKKGVYYEFDSLKVNAKCLSSYTDKALDSGKAGINFNESKMSSSYPMVFDGATLRDTVIDNIKHQMFYWSKKMTYTNSEGKKVQDNYETTLRWYFRKDLKFAPLRLNRKADEKYNAFLVRYETLPELNSNDTALNISKRVEYYPKNLTTHEKKVILAWAKYADEHPVK